MNQTEKEQLRKQCSKFFKCENITDSYKLFDIYAECLYQLIKKHHNEPVNTQSDADAKIILQMMLTKSLHLKGSVEGITYKSKDGSGLNRIVDPTIIALMIRNIFETVGVFNLIYRHTKTTDEKLIVYYLWVSSGLKFRQRFGNYAITKNSMYKLENEKKHLKKIIDIIEKTGLYKRLDEDNKNALKKAIKDRRYLIKFEDTKVIPLTWQDLTKIMGIKNELYDSIYTYFSMYSHPSNVSIFQFSDMFNKTDEAFLNLTNTNLSHHFCLTSIFIADYLKLFPASQTTFDSLNIRDQIVINFRNTLLRGFEYSINDAWEVVN